MAMTKIERYLDPSHAVFRGGELSQDRRYNETTDLNEGAIKIEIYKSTLSPQERTNSILKNVSIEKTDIESKNYQWEAGTSYDLDSHDLVTKRVTAIFDIDFSQNPSTADATKRVYAEIINDRYY